MAKIFYIITFDGEDEFIINRYKSGSRDSNAYVCTMLHHTVTLYRKQKYHLQN